MLIESMKGGSYSAAMLLVNLNFYLPIVLSLTFLKESATPFQLFGIFILTVIIVLVNLRGDGKSADAGRDSGRRKGLLYALVACIGNGLANFFLRVQQHATPNWERNEYYLLMYTGMLVFALVFSLLRLIKKREGEPRTFRIPPLKTTWPSMTGLALCGLGASYPQSILSAMDQINAAAQFTVTIGGSVVLALAIGWIKV